MEKYGFYVRGGFRGCCLLLGWLVAAQSGLRAQNLLTNGSFELPALPGNGDTNSDSGLLSLPGWIYYAPTPNSLLLEYGQPTGSPRFADGRQAVWLNGEGAPVILSQTFPTTNGQNYVLRFAQSDEQNAGPSASQLLVSVAGLSRVFSRTNDTNYVVKTWQFTAISASTTLQFTDTTSAAFPTNSPFLDAVSVLPGSAPIAGTNSPVPGGTGNFASLPTGPSLGGSRIAFFATGTAGQQGIYSTPSDPIIPSDPIRIADLNTLIPSGSGNFATFSGSGGGPPSPSISGSGVVFWGAGGGGQQGIYAIPSDPIFPASPMRIADTATAIPNGSGNFTAFSPDPAYPGDPTISGRAIAFYGAGTAGQQGIYYATLDGVLSRIADTTTFPPGGVSPFNGFNGAATVPPRSGISGNTVVFFATSSGNGSGQVRGIYRSAGGVLSTVADSNTPIPDGTGNFANFVSSAAYPAGLDAGGSTVLFYGRGSGAQQGLYASLNGTLKKVVDTLTPIPQGSGTFTGFSAMSFSGNHLAFIGTGDGGQQGLFVTVPGNPVKVFDLSDTLAGKTLSSLQLSRAGLDSANGRLAFGATFTDGAQALYALALTTDLRITAIARAGNDVRLSYTTQVGHNYAVLSVSNVAAANWSTVLSNLPGSGTISQATVSNALSQPKQFYRIQQEH